MDAARDVNPELDSFREQWRAEVRARNTAVSTSQEQQQQQEGETTVPILSDSSKDTVPRPSRATHPSSGKPKVFDTDEDYVQARAFDEPEPPIQAKKQDDKGKGELVTALDHYERAVEKETQGSLGDSLTLYRKAFRMDHKVDQKYKNKHFASAWAKPAQPVKPTTTVHEPSTTGSSENKALTTEDLVISFSELKIEPAAPPIKGMPQPPCPIASLPEEILVHILRDVAVADVGDYVRLSRVCKRFAWLVGTEDSVWRHICLDSKFGFTCMHYDFQVHPNWRPLLESTRRERAILSGLSDADFDPNELAQRQEEEAYATTIALFNTTYQSSWQKMFRRRPRIRFNGCYISTVNYIRPGQQVNSITWNSPVHIVTYYRYLRLFRDGTAISLCTVDEPSAVVHHMTKENMAVHKGGAMGHLPSSVMHLALPARWKLSSAADYEGKAGDGEKEVSLADSEGDLFVESDGGGNYLYRMELSLRSAGKGARNNKLQWRGFYSFNKTSDVWDEFTLRNDNNKPWFFSRVRTYGFGES
ncbi:hypothetical protein M406DRAFT_346593 [Cryphonectria parasitica EP155]|uniref:F-box domain-containing protein n=1 Tax=Cryphonectria parasitica (strain ATCC 38755 / EP155) TaxID=660469 RepID=A0A9P4Y053_CRYP1|nr:uncharacterized protein M406DRAFT_346593 [Cryphonectria parasitica EP155]KAF3764542.1 hypothetical protein M406DRAFT_346593 [Cryphonectria parasitica EP155]